MSPRIFKQISTDIDYTLKYRHPVAQSFYVVSFKKGISDEYLDGMPYVYRYILYVAGLKCVEYIF